MSVFRWVLIPAVVVGALLVGAPGAQADPYGPGVPTTCHVAGATSMAGGRVAVTVTVSANSATPPTGVVKISVAAGAVAPRARAAGPRAWSTTVRYTGSAVTVRTPRLAGDRHVAAMSFSPDGNLYRACSASATVQGAGVSGGSAGSLPDTGGPSSLWLVLSALLLSAGCASVVVSRQRVER